MKKIINILVVSIIIFTVGVFYFSLNNNSIYDTKGLEGEKIQNIKLERFDENGFIENKDLKNNNYILVNFWASWCAPCRLEHPYLLKLKNEKNLKLIGVNFKDKKNNAKNFLNNYGNPYHELAKDEYGKNSINFGVYGIPESILFDNHYVIIKKVIGPISKKDYDDIKNILKK